MLISSLFNFHLQSVAIGMARSLIPIKLVIKALPLLTTVTVVIGVHSVQLLYCVHLFAEQAEIESCLSFHFHSVEQEQELGFVAGIEVHF